MHGEADGRSIAIVLLLLTFACPGLCEGAASVSFRRLSARIMPAVVPAMPNSKLSTTMPAAITAPRCFRTNFRSR